MNFILKQYFCEHRSIKHPADSDKKAEAKLAASEGNDDFDLEKFILEETRRRRRFAEADEADAKVPDAQAVSPDHVSTGPKFKWLCCC